MSPEQRERVINTLVKFGAYPLRDRTDEELMALLAAGEELREEIDSEYAAACRRRRGRP